MTPEYFAGLFDGEGYIGFPKGKPRIVIGMTDISLPLLMQINAQYGGNINRDRPRSRGWGHIISLKWLSFADVEYVLTVLEPHLILKREQAKLVLWWVKNINYRDNRYGIYDARKVVDDDLKAMKKNMLLTADSSIARIQNCFTASNVVSIR